MPQGKCFFVGNQIYSRGKCDTWPFFDVTLGRFLRLGRDFEEVVRVWWREYYEMVGAGAFAAAQNPIFEIITREFWEL